MTSRVRASGAAVAGSSTGYLPLTTPTAASAAFLSSCFIRTNESEQTLPDFDRVVRLHDVRQLRLEHNALVVDHPRDRDPAIGAAIVQPACERDGLLNRHAGIEHVGTGVAHH